MLIATPKQLPPPYNPISTRPPRWYFSHPSIMKVSWLPTICLLLINITSFLLFLKGFFPSKKILSGFNDTSILLNISESAKFNKVVFMVVDALRSDFMFSEDSGFSYLHQLINNGDAVPFTAFSNPPTVTLPRLKGITLGTTPNFLDAILNIADDKDDSQGLLNQDNWLYQFKHKDTKPKVMNFYGDDTWLKLFPNFFDSTDGTNSFFVSDFYDVDNNVTRHLDQELLPEAPWDGLFLHYLGLDHIGHKTGPYSHFMALKQKEMDGIIERIHKFLQTSKSHKDTLFVVLGDHGMNDIGNHGGSSAGETSPGMVFISSKFKSLKNNHKAPLSTNKDFKYYKQISQIDLIPTLSLLFDLPIPKNNLGMIIKDFLPLFTSKVHHSILLNNCRQFYDLLKVNNPGEVKYDLVIDQLGDVDQDYSFLREIQEDLIDSASNYNYSNLHMAMGISVLCFVVVLAYFNLAMYLNYHLYKEILGLQIGFLVYSIHFHGSSLIEEEHHLWWVFSLGFIMYLYYQTRKTGTFTNFLVILIGLRVIKSWCNTGQKYLYYTTSAYLVDTPGLLWTLVIAAYALVAGLAYFQGSIRHGFNLDISSSNYSTAYFKNDFNNVFAFVILSVLAALSFTFKLVQSYVDGYPIPESLMNFISWNFLSWNVNDFDDKKKILSLLIQISNFASLGVVIMIGLRLVFKYVRGFRIGNLSDIVNLTTFFLMNHTKTELIPLYIVFYIIRFNINRVLVKSKITQIDQLAVYMTVFTMVVSNLSFFSMGGTNSLATVDLSNSYNGVGSYHIEIVSLLTFISNFAGPIYWSLSFLMVLLEAHVNDFDLSKSNEDVVHVKKLGFKILNLRSLVNLVFFSISNLQLVMSCYNLRFHLFIWTVFSPKLLYFGVWFILMNVLIDLVVSGVLVGV